MSTKKRSGRRSRSKTTTTPADIDITPETPTGDEDSPSDALDVASEGMDVEEEESVADEVDVESKVSVEAVTDDENPQLLEGEKKRTRAMCEDMYETSGDLEVQDATPEDDDHNLPTVADRDSEKEEGVEPMASETDDDTEDGKEDETQEVVLKSFVAIVEEDVETQVEEEEGGYPETENRRTIYVGVNKDHEKFVQSLGRHPSYENVSIKAVYSLGVPDSDVQWCWAFSGDTEADGLCIVKGDRTPYMGRNKLFVFPGWRNECHVVGFAWTTCHEDAQELARKYEILRMWKVNILGDPRYVQSRSGIYSFDAPANQH